ncbi:MAG TPA: arsenate reductase ArsC [Candidatus Angelobacter sp.]|nr:arsenate reductase ArsC [Candidatus Angelobacter sp.]
MRKVIFACVHNAGRSQMSAAFFNKFADPGKAIAISAGTQPAERVQPDVVEVMGNVGIDLSKAVPQKLTPELAQDASLLITMGCGDECPFVPGLKRGDWQIVDPKGKDLSQVREIRDEIENRVQQLIKSEGWGRNAAV